jgi:hypothetical protein
MVDFFIPQKYGQILTFRPQVPSRKAKTTLINKSLASISKNPYKSFVHRHLIQKSREIGLPIPLLFSTLRKLFLILLLSLVRFKEFILHIGRHQLVR